MDKFKIQSSNDYTGVNPHSLSFPSFIPQLIKASGGFTRSAFWVQMLADISNCEVQVNDGMLSAARGAAILALEALNYPIVKQGNDANVQSYLPNKERHTIRRW